MELDELLIALQQCRNIQYLISPHNLSPSVVPLVQLHVLQLLGWQGSLTPIQNHPPAVFCCTTLMNRWCAFAKGRNMLADLQETTYYSIKMENT